MMIEAYGSQVLARVVRKHSAVGLKLADQKSIQRAAAERLIVTNVR